MSTTLIDSVKTVFTDTLIAKFSELLGETEMNTQKAVLAAVPLVLTDILHKSYTSEGATRVWNLSKLAAGSDFFGQLHELSVGSGGLVPGSILLNKGNDFTRSLLNDRADPVIHEISRFGGVSVSSASFLAGIAGFASLDSIGRHITNARLDVNGLAHWLQSQRESVLHRIPPALQVKAALGIHHYPGEKTAGSSGKKALYIILALIVLFGIAFFVYRSRVQTDVANPAGTVDTVATTPAPAPANTADTAAAILSPTSKVTLPNGKVLDANKGGTEDQLVSFLGDPHARLDRKKGTWFDFTRIGFASHSASLSSESENQLKNIVEILHAFPKARIKIGGYADNQGDSAANVLLSRQRAGNILAKLKDLGAKSSQLTGAEGYGPNDAVGDNGTRIGRAMNRRMSIHVKAK
jgi:outer membrane protein OmpA-like peptidoglycan-associated protein